MFKSFWIVPLHNRCGGEGMPGACPGSEAHLVKRCYFLANEDKGFRSHRLSISLSMGCEWIEK